MDCSSKFDAIDRQLRVYNGSFNRIKLNDEDAVSNLWDQNSVNGVKLGPNKLNLPLIPRETSPSICEHNDCNYVVLGYINQMLMEEDMEEKTSMFQSSAALQAAEKSFYEVLGEKYPLQPEEDQTQYSDQNSESTHDNYGDYHSSYGCDFLCNSNFLDPGWICDPSDNEFHNSCARSIVNEQMESPSSDYRITSIFEDSLSRVEGANKFLPSCSGLPFDLDNNGLLANGQKKETKGVVIKVEEKHEREEPLEGSRGKKNPFVKDDLVEGRSNKQSALCTESTLSSELFDMVLLGKNDSAFREALQSGVNKNISMNDHSKGSSGGKGRGRKQRGKRDVVDLRTLLTLCAQAVAASDQRNANELLKQVRQHSSATGDGMQRLAYYFASGLEARMASSGSQLYNSLVTIPTSASDILKAYHLYLASCPFRNVTNFFSNKTIIQVTENVKRIHIIDFGIFYGFQWPCLIQRFAARPGGPPKLRITGIDFPNPGFRPSERVEETGRRLAAYAETFKVPFKFNAIAQKWETIQIEDLKIDKDEMLVVNCLYRLRNLLDETIIADSPRNKVLNMIRKMNPDVFIQGIVNGSYNAPFFITRFREALFHFSTLFDMLEANVPREIHERMLFEKLIYGQEALNVIACEGAERIERPETYRQWQVRNVRAGFKQLPLNQEIMDMAKEKAKSYHKDFVIEKDGDWMLQGWKGRIILALSSWRPA